MGFGMGSQANQRTEGASGAWPKVAGVGWNLRLRTQGLEVWRQGERNRKAGLASVLDNSTRMLSYQLLLLSSLDPMAKASLSLSGHSDIIQWQCPSPRGPGGAVHSFS